MRAFARILGLSLRWNRMSRSTPLCHPKGHFFLLLRISSWILLGPIHPLVVKGEGWKTRRFLSIFQMERAMS